MTIFREFVAYTDLLSQDVENLSPATMATLAGFGKLGDYDPVYFEILEDVRQCAELLRLIDPEIDFTDSYETRFGHLRGRDFNDANLDAERAELARDIDEIRAEARHIGEDRFCRLWKRVPRDAHRAFVERLRAAELGDTAEDAPLAPDRRGPPRFDLEPREPGGLSRHGESVHVFLRSLRKA